jgi:CRP-like cAMP-binding protein
MMVIKKPEANSMPNKSLAFFKNLTLFTDMPDAEVARFADTAQIKNYKKGKLLCLEGEQAEFFYIICNGWLKLFHTTEEGEEVILAMLTRDSVIGDNAIFEDGRFTSSAQVAEDAQIISVPLALLKEQLHVNNQLALNMLTSMVQYQRQHELQLKQYLLYSAPQRIGCFLLGLCPVLEQKDGVVLNLPYDKTLIASTLGMKGATFSRALNILREETGIQIVGALVTIDSMERLLKFVNGCYSHPHLRRVLALSK